MASFTACESDFLVVGLQPGEEHVAPVRIAATLIAVTVTSAWLSWRKIKRLSLFFAHWLSGVVMSLGFIIDDMMVTVCWASSSIEGLIKTIKFIELTASNMLAITNLAICINLALIVSSHRTQTRVKSVSSPRVIMMFLVISLGIAAASIPFWDTVIVVGTGFWLTSLDEERRDFLNVLIFIAEFFVGVCMLCIVSWLLVYRMAEIKECWKLHRHIRYYFGLTIIGTAVNLGLGVCGMVFVLENPDTLLLSWSWLFRFVHIALDTVVLYGVLRERSIDERADDARSGSGGVSSGHHVSARGGTNGLSSGRHVSARGTNGSSSGQHHVSGRGAGLSSGHHHVSGRGGTNGASNGQPASARGGARRGPRASNNPTKPIAVAPLA